LNVQFNVHQLGIRNAVKEEMVAGNTLEVQSWN